MRRAGIAPAYSEGFSPHPRISLAAPLAVGVTSQAEMMDIFMERRISPGQFTEKIGPQLPDGISIIEIILVNLQAPSMQSLLRFAEYVVEVETIRTSDDMEAGLAELLAKEQFPWHHSRDTGERYYDLRPLIDDLWLADRQDKSAKIGMRLRCDTSGSGRPEQVARALGYEGFPLSIERTKLIFA